MTIRRATAFTAVLALSATLSTALPAQSPEPTPAFPGQTDAPRTVAPSPPFNVETIATGLTGAWAMAFLPDGNFLITQNGGTMRMVKPNGFVSAPIAGVPGVKRSARRACTTSCSTRTSRGTARSTSPTSRRRRRGAGRLAAALLLRRRVDQVARRAAD